MSYLDLTSHVGCTKDFEAQDGKVVLLREFHNDFVSPSVVRRCGAQHRGQCIGRQVEGDLVIGVRQNAIVCEQSVYTDFPKFL